MAASTANPRKNPPAVSSRSALSRMTIPPKRQNGADRSRQPHGLKQRRLAIYYGHNLIEVSRARRLAYERLRHYQRRHLSYQTDYRQYNRQPQSYR